MDHQTIYLKDYRAPTFFIETVDLTFDLYEEATKVSSKMKVKRSQGKNDLILNGEGLKLLSLLIDGKEWEFDLDDKTLTVKNPPETFTLEIENEINPKENTALDGLYMSDGMFCTQNEPQGFRHITYFLDRPDVMAKYTTTIIADQKYPILLSNGNLIKEGKKGDRHFAVWNDPFPKPTYLFALVAGDLGSIKDQFVTMSGRTVDLHIYCEKGNEHRLHFAMESLKKAMRWDEEVFGLEYDLDIFNVVAVSSFNFGAMENKGLNIFNINAILADQETATDQNFMRVEQVVAHEYFHNWTGDRVTCRDWFQLTLKEGLTVFRDQEFSSDHNFRAVKRIEDVTKLRTLQFTEDQGPTAHPIQPDSYIQVNNFYTSTVYDKGAEVIRMIHTLLGKELFRKGIDTYFALFDGQAVTTEDFVHAMEVASHKDLTQFRKWYHRKGTPIIKASWKEGVLSIEQEGDPLYFPLKVNGDLLEISKNRETFKIDPSRPPSINQNYTAPVIIDADYSKEELLFLMTSDNDPFNRWDAHQEVITRLMLKKELDQAYIQAFGKLLVDPSLFSKMILLPSEDELALRQTVIDIDGNYSIREALKKKLAKEHEKELLEIYESSKEAYTYSKEAVQKRELKNVALAYLAKLGWDDLVYKQFVDADNMTDRFAALSILSDMDSPHRERAFKTFYDAHKKDPLVMSKYFALQGSSTVPGALDRIQKVMQDPAFDIKVPNYVRALLAGFTGNHVQFNTPEGYAFIADQILVLDKINPQVAARIAYAFRKYGKLDPARQKVMAKEMKRILGTKGLSDHTYEIVSKSLGTDKSV
ncbi:MAG: aminopeptidase N [Simkaniaceae bacterium]|nr:aminopeptidase N [Simkaniaceae bacterium]